MAKTVENLLVSVRRNLMEKTGLRYILSTTTSNGNAGGTTLVDSSLNSYKDDHFISCVVRLASGTAAGHKEPLVSDFTGASGTITVAESFGVQVVSGVSYEIMERGLWSDAQLIEYLNAEQDALMDLLSNEALMQITKYADTSGTLGVGDLPSDMQRFISVSANGYNLGLLKPDEFNRLQTDAFISASITRGVAIVQGAKIYYKPASNVTLKVSYVPRLAELTTSQDTQLPDWMTTLLTLRTTAHAFLASEDFANANAYLAMANERINAANLQYKDKTTGGA